jgi:hypothetical protein
MYLMELFTQPIQWEYDTHKNDRIAASFIIDDFKYRVYMGYDSSGSFGLGGPEEIFPKMWEVSFSIAPVTSLGDGDGEADDITGTGNAIKVFSTVIDIIQTTAENLDIQHLFFTADEPSRIKLYDRMASYFATKGWRYVADQEIRARSGGEQDGNLYLLTKQAHPHSQLKGTRAA